MLVSHLAGRASGTQCPAAARPQARTSSVAHPSRRGTVLEKAHPRWGQEGLV
ncbi:hypothetical protein Cadr_000031204, partial [Camelus dromedarius]